MQTCFNLRNNPQNDERMNLMSMQATAACYLRVGGPQQPGQQNPPLIHHAFQGSMSAPSSTTPIPPYACARPSALTVHHSFAGAKTPWPRARHARLYTVGGASEGGAFFHRTKGEKSRPAVPVGVESSTRAHGFLRVAEHFGTIWWTHDQGHLRIWTKFAQLPFLLLYTEYPCTCILNQNR